MSKMITANEVFKMSSAQIVDTINKLTVCRDHWKKSYIELKRSVRDLVTNKISEPKEAR